MEIGPNVTDLAGNWMDQDGDGVPGQIPQDRYVERFTLQRTYTYRTSIVNAPIRDFSITRVPLTIRTPILISRINVQVNMPVSWARRCV